MMPNGRARCRPVQYPFERVRNYSEAATLTLTEDPNALNGGDMATFWTQARRRRLAAYAAGAGSILDISGRGTAIALRRQARYSRARSTRTALTAYSKTVGGHWSRVVERERPVD